MKHANRSEEIYRMETSIIPMIDDVFHKSRGFGRTYRSVSHRSAFNGGKNENAFVLNR